MNEIEEVLHFVSKCCKAPCKYRKGITKSDEEVMVPFCCECEEMTTQQEVRLSREQKEKNKNTLMYSIFPGMEDWIRRQ